MPVSEFRLRRRVQFYEVDFAGIVHFSWFFRYMEEAEHGLWREAGLSIAAHDAGLAFPRVAASFEYRRPLRFEEEFDVSIRIAAIGEKTIRYACEVTRGDTRIATGAMTIACVSHRPGEPMKAVAIPASFASRFQVATE
ncbi:MAG: acyl-CoA thioesterase [Acidobacteria bacterium]|nr:acyl-CoA thioesterase [Acidobacteriota bacterium]